MYKEVGRGPSLFVLLALTQNLMVRKTYIVFIALYRFPVAKCGNKNLAESNSRQLALTIYFWSFRKIYQIYAKDTSIGRIPKVDHSFSYKKQKT